MKPEYIQLLTKEERAGAMKLGAMMKMAQAGMRPSEKAAAIAVSPGGVAKTIIAVSLLAGIPVGIAAHVVGKQINKQRAEEKELKEKIKFYRNATQTMESGLATPMTPSQPLASQPEM